MIAYGPAAAAPSTVAAARLMRVVSIVERWSRSCGSASEWGAPRSAVVVAREAANSAMMGSSRDARMIVLRLVFNMVEPATKRAFGGFSRSGWLDAAAPRFI